MYVEPDKIVQDDLVGRMEAIIHEWELHDRKPVTESGYITRFQAIVACIGLIVSLGTMTINLKTDIATLQYQETLSIADRAAIHTTLDNIKDNQTTFSSQVLQRLEHIETLVAQNSYQTATNTAQIDNKRKP